jgi:hypothetical protein
MKMNNDDLSGSEQLIAEESQEIEEILYPEFQMA